MSAAYRQSNSGSWTPLASESLDGLPDSILVGLAVTSHETGSLATGTFDNIAIGSAF